MEIPQKPDSFDELTALEVKTLLEDFPSKVEHILKTFKKFGLTIFINKEKETLIIKGNKKQIIGIIGAGKFHIGNNYENHLLIEIDEDIRGFGVGKKLFNLYENLFGALDIEYAKTLSFIRFYESVGYEIELWVDKNGEEISEPELFELLQETWGVEDELPYICILKKNKS